MIWISLYILMGLALLGGAIGWLVNKLRLTFDLPPADGDLLYSEKFRKVALDHGRVSLITANIVFTPISVLVSPCALLYKDRTSLPELFRIAVADIQSSSRWNDGEYNIAIFVNDGEIRRTWKFNFEAPDRVEHILERLGHKPN